jgi:hypothetical protein
VSYLPHADGEDLVSRRSAAAREGPVVLVSRIKPLRQFSLRVDPEHLELADAITGWLEEFGGTSYGKRSDVLRDGLSRGLMEIKLELEDDSIAVYLTLPEIWLLEQILWIETERTPRDAPDHAALSSVSVKIRDVLFTFMKKVPAFAAAIETRRVRRRETLEEIQDKYIAAGRDPQEALEEIVEAIGGRNTLQAPQARSPVLTTKEREKKELQERTREEMTRRKRDLVEKIRRTIFRELEASPVGEVSDRRLVRVLDYKHREELSAVLESEIKSGRLVMEARERSGAGEGVWYRRGDG